MDTGRLTEEERYLFGEGTFYRCYRKLGAHPALEDGAEGYGFAVWAPEVKSVAVTGSFCGWDKAGLPMRPEPGGELWRLFVPGARAGDLYKFVITTETGELLYRADPCAFEAELPPGTASRLCAFTDFEWSDAKWLAARKRADARRSPMNIYELHLGSWKRHGDGSAYSYRELAETLVPYAAEMGYTHLELMPVMEHPFDGSWGYQLTGYFAPTSRYGPPEDFKYFVDCCHAAGLAVILDWVPGHFCRDEQGLGRFSGKRLYEKGDHAQWGTYRFDLGRPQVRSFLISNALFWLDEYHADALRVDGVTSMLYLNFGVSDPSQKRFNERGTEEDLEAVDFLQKLNTAVAEHCPGALMIAEESTAWPLVTYPPCDGGLGFHFKWDMGWMNDTLRYMRTDFPYRPENHTLLTFSMAYAFNENFILPLSHDEVVHGKLSLIGRMPGDYAARFAGLRLLALYQICHPGGKLSFMGSEIAQFIEWRYYEGIEWFLTDYEAHEKHQTFIKRLNALYKRERALWQEGFSWDGFRWLDADDSAQSVLAFVRSGERPEDDLVALLNFRPDAYGSFRVGVPRAGRYRELLNSDGAEFGGTGMTNSAVLAEDIPWHGMERSVSVKLPPLSGLILKRTGKK